MALGSRSGSASLVTQTVRNPAAVQKTRVQCLRRGDPLEKGMATHSSILGDPMDRVAWQAAVRRVTESGTGLGD